MLRIQQDVEAFVHQVGTRVMHSEKNDTGAFTLSPGKNKRKIKIQSKQNSILVGGTFENFGIICLGHTDISYVNGIMAVGFQPCSGSFGDSHVKKEIHELVQKLGCGKCFFTGKPCTIFQCFFDIFLSKVGIILKNVFRFFSGSQKIQNKVNRDT